MSLSRAANSDAVRWYSNRGSVGILSSDRRSVYSKISSGQRFESRILVGNRHSFYEVRISRLGFFFDSSKGEAGSQESQDPAG